MSGFISVDVVRWFMALISDRIHGFEHEMNTGDQFGIGDCADGLGMSMLSSFMIKGTEFHIRLVGIFGGQI